MKTKHQNFSSQSILWNWFLYFFLFNFCLFIFNVRWYRMVCIPFWNYYFSCAYRILLTSLPWLHRSIRTTSRLLNKFILQQNKFFYISKFIIDQKVIRQLFIYHFVFKKCCLDWIVLCMYRTWFWAAQSSIPQIYFCRLH